MNIYSFIYFLVWKKERKFVVISVSHSVEKNNIDLLNVSPSRTYWLTRRFVNNGLEYLLEKYYLNKLK